MSNFNASSLAALARRRHKKDKKDSDQSRRGKARQGSPLKKLASPPPRKQAHVQGLDAAAAGNPDPGEGNLIAEDKSEPGHAEGRELRVDAVLSDALRATLPEEREEAPIEELTPASQQAPELASGAATGSVVEDDSQMQVGDNNDVEADLQDAAGADEPRLNFRAAAGKLVPVRPATQLPLLQNLKLSKTLTEASVPTRQATAANAVFVTPGIERDSIFLVPWLREFPNGVRPANAREMDALLKLAFPDHPHFRNVNGIFYVGSKDSLFERLTVLSHPDPPNASFAYHMWPYEHRQATAFLVPMKYAREHLLGGHPQQVAEGSAPNRRCVCRQITHHPHHWADHCQRAPGNP